MTIVIQSAHQTGIDGVRNVQSLQTFLDGFKKFARFFVQVCRHFRRAFNDFFIAFVFGIQYAQRILVQTVQAVFRKFVLMRRKIRYQRFTVRRAAFQIAQSIQFQTDKVLQPESL